MKDEKKRASGTTDLTTGRPLVRILMFALPLVLGTLFQQLYSFADTVIVGRCLGTEALAAVGSTYSLNFLILGFVQGTCVGFGIPVAEAFGAKNRDDLHRYLSNGALLCVVLGVVLTVLTTLFAAPLLQLIHTPKDIFDAAVLYIRIIFIGIPATVLYNYSASVLRSLGDSRHPFYFLLATSVLNIVLDWVLIVPCGMGGGWCGHRHGGQPAVERHTVYLVVLCPRGGHPLHPRESEVLRPALQAAGLHRAADGV